mmetsp:Transcript_59882/g.177504  ORF Transcript_59882/g.177504 Transcript_59882/m.177504 type:complete len:238 (-) Transcript_59882:447-1160(-)
MRKRSWTRSFRFSVGVSLEESPTVLAFLRERESRGVPDVLLFAFAVLAAFRSWSPSDSPSLCSKELVATAAFASLATAAMPLASKPVANAGACPSMADTAIDVASKPAATPADMAAARLVSAAAAMAIHEASSCARRDFLAFSAAVAMAAACPFAPPYLACFVESDCSSVFEGLRVGRVFIGVRTFRPLATAAMTLASSSGSTVSCCAEARSFSNSEASRARRDFLGFGFLESSCPF